jgi:LuxR family maltose regulon positive regulatory protein
MCGPLCDAILGLAATDERSRTTGQSVVVADGRPSAADRPAAFVLRPASNSYSQLILDQLERANLFLIPLDDERYWYRYHHLFAEVLHARLRSGATASEVLPLYQRASVWHAQVGLIGEAVRYAFLAHDIEQAAALIEQHGMAIILNSSDVSLVQAWVEQLPHALIPARPRLVVVTGIILGVRRQFDAVERLLAEAAPALSAADLSPNMLGELATLRSTIARFQSDAGTQALAQQALTLLDHNNYGFRAIATINLGIACLERGEFRAARAALTDAMALGELGGLWIALAALEELMSLQRRQGQLHAMLRTSEQGVELSLRLGRRRIPATGMGYVGIAEVCYERNDLAAATQAAQQGIELLRGSTERLLLVRGYCVLAQIAQTQADSDSALANIQRGEEWLTQTGITTPKYFALLAACRTRQWVRQGNLAAAARWEEEYVFVGESEVDYVQQLSLVRLRLAQSYRDPGEQVLEEAGSLLAQLIPTVEMLGWVRYLIEGLMLQALVCRRQANPTGALTALQHALTLAEPEGYVRMFVDEGAPMAALVAQSAEHTAQNDPLRVYAEHLLAAFPEAKETSRPGDKHLPSFDRAHSQSPDLSVSASLVEPLSDRELEVLRLIADGHSNQAIADRLVVAVSTVKKHNNNLYGKLDVQSRTQALARARAIKLL